MTLDLAHVAQRNPWWAGRTTPPSVPRAATPRILAALEGEHVAAIWGLRRVGKTTMMRQAIADLLSRGVPARDILFVDFEDVALAESLLDASALSSLWGLYFETQRPLGRPWVFLDEIQVVGEWPRWVRLMQETGQARICVSGSSNQLLRPELGTVLTGRHVPIEVHPLSFQEYLGFRALSVRDALTASADVPSARAALMDYMEYGGLPAVAAQRGRLDPPHGGGLSQDAVDHANLERLDLLRTYFDDILYRDVIARHSGRIRTVQSLRDVAAYYLETTARPFSLQRVKNRFQLGLDQVRDYTEFLRSSGLVHIVDIDDPNPGRRARADRKAYAADVGVRNAVTARFAPDVGWLAETLVLQHLLLRPGGRMTYHREARECDFVLRRPGRVEEVIQVCYEDASVLPPRELEGVLEAMARFDLAAGTIVTRHQDREHVVDGRTIREVPLWRWLLEWNP